ncbi:MAG: hypothetical protein AAF798_10345 [Bacteroidota bacterium]
MKQIETQQLWDFIDGQCTAEEAATLKSALETDPNVKAEWAKRFKLHQQLSELPAEQPSMRFVQNLMDKLPLLYRKLSIAPLVKPFWVKTALGFLALLLVGYIGFVFFYIEQFGVNGQFTYLESMKNYLNQAPAKFLILFAAISISLSCLFVLDRFLKARFQKESQASSS